MAKADAVTTANAIPPMTLAFIRLSPSVRRDCSTAGDVDGPAKAEATYEDPRRTADQRVSLDRPHSRHQGRDSRSDDHADIFGPAEFASCGKQERGCE